MKASKYSVLFIPNTGEKSRQFNISRSKIIFAISLAALVTVVVLFILLYGFPKLLKYEAMESKYNQYITERVQIMELMQEDTHRNPELFNT